jgi:DNA helicase-2/ATP-dependent DNA helicase PcrA
MKSYKDKFVFKDCSFDEEDLRLYFKAYEDYKLKNNLYDFTDWLIMCYDLVKNQPCEYQYVLVDEHQDNNYIRNLLLKEWARHGNIFYVGDYRQSIYAFNGAIPEMFMDIDKQWDNANIINMDINYRSCKNIVDNANKFIKQYYGDYKYYSDSIAHNQNDGRIEYSTYFIKQDEGKEIANRIEDLINNGEDINDIAVLYRNNSHADYVENELKRRGIEYYISENKGFFNRKETQLIVSYLKLIDDPHNDETFDALFKLRNHPIMYIKNKDYDQIKYNSGKKNISFYESFITYRFSNYRDLNSVKEFKDNIEWLRLQKEKHDTDITKLIDNIVKTFDINNYIEENFESDEIEGRKNSIQVLKSFANGNTLKSFIRFVSTDNSRKKIKDGVKLMTIHASKGLEFKHVFVISIEDGKFPSDKTDVLEEARLFYVAVTRPKENLYLSQIGEGNSFINEYFNIKN